VGWWVNHADLFRLRGVGSEYADLLEAAGVDSVPELAQRNAVNLQAKLSEENEAKQLMRVVPREAQVARVDRLGAVARSGRPPLIGSKAAPRPRRRLRSPSACGRCARLGS
jgi:hypothetical protein